ncbi:hypothetical protein AB8O64_37005 (plasmid) [Streptomyces sp. QH1-20]|uniref:hypothetical protein n=1 Tax=Streptomyces sp. QH1-20 TaxID=3240934 RepID=UPI003515C956
MADEIVAIERALVRGEWVPDQEERALGGAVLECRDRLVEEPSPADMPPSERGLWLTQSLMLQALLVRELTDGLLPQWQDRLVSSPMLHLVQAYADAIQPVLPYAARLLAAWQASPPPTPAPDLVAREAERLRVSAVEAEQNTRFWDAHHWEEAQVAGAERAEIELALHRCGDIATVIYAAVTGQTDY